MVVVIVLLAVLVVLVGTGAALVASRRRNAALLEPPPDAPRVPPEVLEEVRREAAEREAAETEPGEGLDDDSVAGVVVEELDRRDADAVVAEAEAALAEAAAVEEVARPRFRDRLTKARSALAGAFGSIGGRGKIDDETWDELEEALIRADVGVAATQDLLEHLRGRVKADGLTDGEQLLEALKAELKERLVAATSASSSSAVEPGPSVWLFVGVNGVGKTTTIGKLGTREARGRHQGRHGRR